jgi:hypothetical protein
MSSRDDRARLIRRVDEALASQQLVLAWTEARRALRAAARWKALAKRLWKNPHPNRGGTGRHGCAEERARRELGDKILDVYPKRKDG